MFTDARLLPAGTTHNCDVCVIGGGAAGIAIVDRLIDSGLSVVLLEAGGFYVEQHTQELFSGETVGHPYFPLESCRIRQLGGSTTRWGGWCRPLENVDFSTREWLPWSGWPISEADLKQYYDDAAGVFDLPTSDPAPYSVSDSFEECLRDKDSRFRTIAYQRSPRTNFGKKFRTRISTARNVFSVLNANVTEMRLDPGQNRVSQVMAKALDGPAVCVRPRAVVLAAGGIENARILLASTRDRSAGLGNEYDNVGRFFMEHLHVPAGHLATKKSGKGLAHVRARFHQGPKLQGFLSPTEAAQDNFQLLGASIALESPGYSFGTPLIGLSSPFISNAFNLYDRLLDSPIGPAAQLVREATTQACHLVTRYRTWSSARMAEDSLRSNDYDIHPLYFRSEQAPDKANRVYLGERLDVLGMPQVILNWRPTTLDLNSISSWLGILDDDFRRMELGELVHPQNDWQSQVIGGPHHMGTTRMSTTPRTGVVDKDCRVHSVDNLFVAGASVFATGGFANPTFTVVAMALRLADKIRQDLTSYVICQETE